MRRRRRRKRVEQQGGRCPAPRPSPETTSGPTAGGATSPPVTSGDRPSPPVTSAPEGFPVEFARAVAEAMRGSAEHVETDDATRLRRKPAAVVIESPPLPQRTVTEQTFVPYETDEYQNAHVWACQQISNKYPGSVGMVDTLNSLIEQKLRSEKP